MITTDCEPDVSTVPLQAPLATHELALVDDQITVTESPFMAFAVDTVIVAVGCGADPPPPHEARKIAKKTETKPRIIIYISAPDDRYLFFESTEFNSVTLMIKSTKLSGYIQSGVPSDYLSI